MRAPIHPRAAGHRRLLGLALAGALLAACGQAESSSPGSSVVTSPSASAAPTDGLPSPAASPGASTTASGGVPPLLANVPGFDVSPIEPLVLDGFRTAAQASLGTNASLGDVVGARAINASNDPVDLIAFTLVPESGVTENDALFLIMDTLAEGADSSWVADEAIGWFALDHESGRALMIPWGNVPGGTVFLLVVGAGDAPVDDVANAILGAG